MDLNTVIGSLGVSDHVLTDVVLEKVAHQMWAKELVQKHMKSYTQKWSLAQGEKMQTFKFRDDQRVDDGLVTPRGKGSKSMTVFPNAICNPDSKFEFREYEEEEAPPPKLDAFAKENKNGQFLEIN